MRPPLHHEYTACKMHATTKKRKYYRSGKILKGAAIESKRELAGKGRWNARARALEARAP